jgi:hypothetical protein
MDESLPAGQPTPPTNRSAATIRSAIGPAVADLWLYAAVWLVGLVVAFVWGSAVLSWLDTFLAGRGVRMVESSKVPTPSRIDLILAWTTLSLAIAELLHFFPAFPACMTRWLIRFTYPKPLTWLRSMETGFLFMAIGALIAKTIFT